jgi:hypothetical protein
LSNENFDFFENLSKFLANYSKDTFWLGKNDEPICELEILAKNIFLKHTENIIFNGEHVLGVCLYIYTYM